jgi:hypothetical protein
MGARNAARRGADGVGLVPQHLYSAFFRVWRKAWMRRKVLENNQEKEG